jgi:hypothetical protein
MYHRFRLRSRGQVISGLYGPGTANAKMLSIPEPK